MAYTQFVFMTEATGTPEANFSTLEANFSTLEANFSNTFIRAQEMFDEYEAQYPYNFSRVLSHTTIFISIVIAQLLGIFILTISFQNAVSPFTLLMRFIDFGLGNLPVEQDNSPSPIPNEKEDVIENVSLVSKLGKLGLTPKVGDIIRFDERKVRDTESENTEKEKFSKFGSVPRCISTYGNNPLDPRPGYTVDETGEHFTGELYVVKSVSSVIPNCKTAVHYHLNGIKNQDTTKFTHIEVEPLEGFKMNEMIFWYINFEGLAICQFESGTVTHLIDNLEIIGHDDRYRRSSCPSPNSSISDDYDGEYDEQGEDSCDFDCEYDLIDDDDTNDVFKSNSNWDGNIGYYGGDPNFNDGDY